MSSWLAPFDPARDFVVRTHTLLAGGTQYRAGQLFNKNGVKERVVRMLYDQRQIGYADDPTAGNTRRDPLDHDGNGKKGGSKPKPSDSELELAERLAASKTKPQLLELAEGVDGIRKDMNKAAIALALVRAGRGPA